jgi:oligoendopeptidase F
VILAYIRKAHALQSCIVLGLVAALTAGCHAAQRAAPSDVDRYVWDLRPLYASHAAWEADREAVQRELTTVTRFKGTLGRDARTFATGIEEMSDMRQRVANMQEYAILTSNLDINSASAQADKATANALAAQVESTLSFADYEIRDIGIARIELFFREQPRLEMYRLRIHQTLVNAPHLLSPQAERLARSAQLWPLVSSDAVNAVYETDLPWPQVRDESETERRVTPELFALLRKSRNRAVRDAANVAYFNRLHTLEPLFAVMIDDRISADLALARARGFRDGMDALLFREGIPPRAIPTMLAVTRANSGLLRRYVALRAKALAVSGSYEDSFVAPPGIANTFSVAQTKAITLGAAAELGARFQDRLRHELETPWIHLPPWPQKRNTYGFWGNNIGGKPGFGFMKYDGSYRSSANYAGLAISVMAFWTMPKNRPTDTRIDPSVYGNALVFAGNILHNDYLREHTASRDEQIAYLIYGLDRLRQIVFDEAAIVEHERDLQGRLLRGEEPTGAEISASYLDIVRSYREDPGLGETVAPMFAGEWMDNGLAFESFEDQNFPLAMAAACSLVEKARAGDPRARNGFEGVRGRIGSDFSYDLLKAAGVDLATPAPYEAEMRRMRLLVNDLEQLIGAS